MGRRAKKVVIKVPENFCTETRRFMKNVVTELNDREEMNPLLMEGVLLMLMNCYETYQKACREIRLGDEVLMTTTKDEVVAHPAVSVQLKSNQQVLMLMKELGLTLKSRKVLDRVDDGKDNLSLFLEGDFES